MLLEDLTKYIDPEAPSFITFHQGSYALRTGVNPLEGDPDMDIGVIFDCEPSQYPDPVVLKRYVCKALDRNNRTVRIRKPCVTAEYFRAGVRELHVDLAIYCKAPDGETHLARGRDSDPADTKHRFWEPSAAQKLNDHIINAFKDSDRDQWRRIVRYLKRWRDLKIGHGNIPSIGLTILAVNHFRAIYSAADAQPRDLIAFKAMLESILMNWIGARLVVPLPVAPRSDLMEKVTDKQMEDFKNRLINLKDRLAEADLEADTHEACKILNKEFGDDFVVPPKPTTTKKVETAVTTTGRSA